jgi:hypothetical protein
MLPKGEGEVLRHYSRGDDALEILPVALAREKKIKKTHLLCRQYIIVHRQHHKPRAMRWMDGWMVIITSSSSHHHHDGAFIFQKDGGKMKI